jgi:nucleoside 2-deoxyribosyltransferase
MSRVKQKISFEGLLQKNVLDTFTVIRGFADLHDLASVSTAIPYQTGSSGQVTGYQRDLDSAHIEDIERFLMVSPYRFFPEIVLSLRSNGKDDPIASYVKRRKSEYDAAYRITVNLKALRADPLGRIHRIDGNHRLEAARRVFEKQRRAGQVRGFIKAPFCFVIMEPDPPDIAELSEAMLFNLINSKALPIMSEHSLKVLMRDDRNPPERFAEDPQVYLTRWMHEKVRDWPQGFFAAMGNAPLTRLHSAAGVMLRPGGISKATQKEMETEAGHIFGPLYELAVTLRALHEKFVHSYAFLPIAAEVYARHSKVDSSKGANTEAERLRRAENWLRNFAGWFDHIGAADLPMPADPSILWTVFKRDFDKRAGQVFIAMSFRESKTLDAVYKAMEEAIDQFNSAHTNAKLAPKRIDKQHGASYEIPARVFHEIDQSRLVIADLTDEKQNVYCEVGYAKARGVPFFLTFRKKEGVTPPNKVHFDLAPQRYIEYDNPIDLRDQLIKELNAWFENS